MPAALAVSWINGLASHEKDSRKLSFLQFTVMFITQHKLYPYDDDATETITWKTVTSKNLV